RLAPDPLQLGANPGQLGDESQLGPQDLVFALDRGHALKLGLSSSFLRAHPASSRLGWLLTLLGQLVICYRLKRGISAHRARRALLGPGCPGFQLLAARGALEHLALGLRRLLPVLFALRRRL